MNYKTIENNLLAIKEQLSLFDTKSRPQAIEAKQLDINDWDFADANTKIETHGFHSYPAMMIPQIARSLIQMYGEEGKILLDPFCGSGTALVEARLQGLNSYGIDINPLALLLSRVKTTPLDVKELKKVSLKLCDNYLNTFNELATVSDKELIPKFFNIDYWFHPEVSRQLYILRSVIDSIRDNNIKEFFLVAFSQLVRNVSYTRSGEFKLFRIPEEEIPKFRPNVVKIFFEVVQKNLRGMNEFITKTDKNVFVKILDEDSRTKTSIPSKSVDLVVTSPPYGDSRTTVAYGQFSRLSLQWLNLPWERVRNIDTHSLGGKRISQSYKLNKSSSLRKIIQEIKQIDSKRSLDVAAFFNDLEMCFKEINRVCKKGATACFVVGNRTVKGIKILTDEIISEIGESLGFRLKDTITRNIPNKRMPLKNSPSNIEGKLGETMTKEHIVILIKKEEVERE